jgi:hypothetical protein
MERQSWIGSGRSRSKPRTAAALARTALALAILGLGTAASVTQPAAQNAPAEVGYVTSVSGRVIVLAGGTPLLLEPLDAIRDRSRIDLQAGSELRICHYTSQRLLTLKGPLRVSVSPSGVTGENGRALDAGGAPCVPPHASKHQGGLVARGVILTGAR